MKYLIGLLLIFFFSSQLIAGNIDERKTDIYFANGVGATTKLASFIQGQVQVDAYQIATPSTQQFIAEYYLAFNTGHGVIPDFFEAFLQFTDENPSSFLTWSAFKIAIGRATGIGGGVINMLSRSISPDME